MQNIFGGGKLVLLGNILVIWFKIFNQIYLVSNYAGDYKGIFISTILFSSNCILFFKMVQKRQITELIHVMYVLNLLVAFVPFYL